MKNIIYKYYLRVYSILYRILIFILPIKENVLLFESSVGRSYSGNPKYIYEEIVRQGLDHHFRCIWILDNTSTRIVGRSQKVRKMRLKHLYYAVIAGFWIVDSRQTDTFRKRKGSIFIQTWHGTPLKKLALDMQVMNIGGETNLLDYKEKFKNQVKSWDYLISQNQYSTRKFTSAFAFQNEIWEIGYPRNDILVNCNNQGAIINYKMKLALPLDKKIILYAPTWRDDEYYEPGKWKLKLQLDIDQMQSRLGKEYVVIIKLHYFMQDEIKLDQNLQDFIRVFNSDQDIQILYLVSDILITDYSSVMFDYSILRRPIIFYVYDLEKYKNELRGFYFDLYQEAPGPVVNSQEQLMVEIENIQDKFDSYKDKYDLFTKKFNYLDDGMASKRAVNMINKLYSKVKKKKQ